MDTIIRILEALDVDLIQLAGLILSLFVSAGANELRKRWGVEVEIKRDVQVENLRLRLEEVITRAAADAVKAAPGAAHDHIVDAVTGYVEGGIPDTIKALGASKDALRKRVSATIRELTAG